VPVWAAIIAVVDAVAELERGRAAYSVEAWSDAYGSLSAADRTDPLGPDDLELLATCAYMVGREAEYRELLERAHRAHLDAGAEVAALRCAFWIGVTLASHGEIGRASGWLRRARRLLERQGGERVERGYLLLPVVFEQEASGDWEAAAATASEAAAIGERFGDPDLFALAAHEQGEILIKLGRLDEGLGLLDEAMVAVTAGELSPIVAGIVYCGVILACQDAHEVRRAREWTAALSTWCARQPDLVAFTGRCLAHRAEIMQLEGAFSDALEEARRAAERCLQGENPAAAGEAFTGRSRRAGGDPPRLHRDHARGRRPRGRPERLPRTRIDRPGSGDGRPRGAGSPGAGRGEAGFRRCRRRADFASPRE
jgi:tetratricopeptide (TPR) repeat protein